MDFLKAFFLWMFMALVIAAAIVAAVKGGALGIACLAAVTVIYLIMFTVFGCKTH
jgi:hypothetical protein